ncbi:MAG: DUF4398 domain-containing protein [Proteobacteria bacterium]|nr:DUF4398 domain-containing protein [Pseudomonadota bacterium]
MGLAVLLCVGSLGCGPVGYLQTVTFDARELVREAEDVRAPELAPYEYHAAWEYLRMAREFGARADFELAIDYGKRSARLARDGRRRAERVARERRDAAARRKAESKGKSAPQPGDAPDDAPGDAPGGAPGDAPDDPPLR